MALWGNGKGSYNGHYIWKAYMPTDDSAWKASKTATTYKVDNLWVGAHSNNYGLSTKTAQATLKATDKTTYSKKDLTFYSGYGDTVNKRLIGGDGGYSYTWNRKETAYDVTISFSVTMTFSSSSAPGKLGASGTSKGSKTITIPALDSWSVTYNANGGTGAPATQKKIYGKALSLSSTKPTKSGYVFKGWGTSANGNVVYLPGATYTENAGASLYAIWSAVEDPKKEETTPVYTITIDGNGGDVSTSSFVELENTVINLGSITATKDGYRHTGWSLQADGEVNYTADAQYTVTGNTTLYAVWTEEKPLPVIKNIVALRANSSGEESYDGTYCNLSFDWDPDVNITDVSVSYSDSDSKTLTALDGVSIDEAARMASGTGLGDGEFQNDKTYYILITVTDAYGQTNVFTEVLTTSFFTIDILKGGHGIAFGMVSSKEDTMEVGFKEFKAYGTVSDKDGNLRDAIDGAGTSGLTNLEIEALLEKADEMEE